MPCGRLSRTTSRQRSPAASSGSASTVPPLLRLRVPREREARRHDGTGGFDALDGEREARAARGGLRQLVDHADERDVLAFPVVGERIGKADLRAPRGVAESERDRSEHHEGGAAERRSADREARACAGHHEAKPSAAMPSHGANAGSSGCHCSSRTPMENAASAGSSTGIGSGTGYGTVMPAHRVRHGGGRKAALSAEGRRGSARTLQILRQAHDTRHSPDG